ncbi:HAD family hydrolase [Limnochorda pilosa]|uniref:Haloacid dehalogenase n=1 Tax=Limnochorda pilosa TaxID=1555112 RepID=A0A0K2SM22_LIMPI|nr:HAD family phosphatase [Limnochorda pilosa]BAS27884.1 haloacid dehalogenase [Limnochorda pilosa]
MPAAIFDMDGVLIISNPAHLQAWKEYGGRHGLEISDEMYYRAFSGRRNDEGLEELFPGRFTREERLQLSEAKEAYYREHFAPKLQPVPGVVELVRALADRRVPLALATSGPRENAELILRQLGLRDLFGVLVAGFDVPAAKPDPAIFLEAARQLGTPPAECVVFEDSPAGVEAASRAGARCVAVTTSDRAETLRDRGAHLVVDDFTHLDVDGLLGSNGVLPR